MFFSSLQFQSKQFSMTEMNMNIWMPIAYSTFTLSRDDPE